MSKIDVAQADDCASVQMNVMVVVSPVPVSVGTFASASLVARVGCRVIDTGINNIVVIVIT